jgi:ElaB/YqjD/DUF883 family membrane-anchored ribosome-binding protein
MERRQPANGYDADLLQSESTMADTTEPATNDEARMTDQATSGNARRGAKPGVRSTVKSKLAEQGDALRGQARTKAREYAEQGKSKATDTLDGVSRFFNETASTVDKQLGSDVGDYVHRAAEAVAGFTDALKQKDVEELLDEARDAVRRNPALAIGAAAAVGFVLVRLLKSATPAEEEQKPVRKSTPTRTKAPRAHNSNVD